MNTRLEPTIDELLSDPIAVVLMRRDGLQPADVHHQMLKARVALTQRRQPVSIAAE